MERLVASKHFLRIFALTVAASLLSLAAPARAANDDCILDRCADRAPQAQSGASESSGRLRGSAPASGFDFYVLALSWSPGFCEIDGGERAQCEPGEGKHFVVHGLWPQYDRGYPSDCAGPRAPSRVALEHAKDLFPDEGLARHEWRKHGTCSGKSPSDYFDDVARARQEVTIPSALSAPAQDQTFSPIDIERAFLAVNPRLRPGMMAVGCRRSVLEDVKICFSRDLREFVSCPEVARRSCRSREISVPAPL